MLYELISVVRPGSVREVKEIAKTAGSLILQRNGVIRGLTNWGVFNLPSPMRGLKGGGKHHAGHYFIMRFDAGARTQHTLRKTLALEPRLLRFSVVKLGSRLDEIADVGGVAEEWKDVPGSRGMDLRREMASEEHLI